MLCSHKNLYQNHDQTCYSHSHQSRCFDSLMEYVSFDTCVKQTAGGLGGRSMRRQRTHAQPRLSAPELSSSYHPDGNTNGHGNRIPRGHAGDERTREDERSHTPGRAGEVQRRDSLFKRVESLLGGAWRVRGQLTNIDVNIHNAPGCVLVWPAASPHKSPACHAMQLKHPTLCSAHACNTPACLTREIAFCHLQVNMHGLKPDDILVHGQGDRGDEWEGEGDGKPLTPNSRVAGVRARLQFWIVMLPVNTSLSVTP